MNYSFFEINQRSTDLISKALGIVKKFCFIETKKNRFLGGKVMLFLKLKRFYC
jgi:hypothetical protein